MAAAPRRLPADDHDDDSRDARMGFLGHLDELRTRIVRAGIDLDVGNARPEARLFRCAARLAA